jgi:hypothetical protein
VDGCQGQVVVLPAEEDEALAALRLGVGAELGKTAAALDRVDLERLRGARPEDAYKGPVGADVFPVVLLVGTGEGCQWVGLAVNMEKGSWTLREDGLTK